MACPPRRRVAWLHKLRKKQSKDKPLSQKKFNKLYEQVVHGHLVWVCDKARLKYNVNLRNQDGSMLVYFVLDLKGIKMEGEIAGERSAITKSLWSTDPPHVSISYDRVVANYLELNRTVIKMYKCIAALQGDEVWSCFAPVYDKGVLMVRPTCMLHALVVELQDCLPGGLDHRVQREERIHISTWNPELHQG